MTPIRTSLKSYLDELTDPLSLRWRLGLPHARVPSRSTLQHTPAHLNVDDLLRARQTWVEEARAIWPHAQAHLQLATR
ncbi:MAG: hypothetical protein NZM18_10755 [Thermoflexales bacterium]|nr:hypothetical protein [Thermoflexales bacterium]